MFNIQNKLKGVFGGVINIKELTVLNNVEENFINIKLLEEILIMIFKSLTIQEQFKIRSVCKYWKQLLDHVLNMKSDLVIIEEGTTGTYTLNNFKKLSKLDYVYYKKDEIDCGMIKEVLDKCDNLNTLYLDSRDYDIDKRVLSLFNENNWEKLENIILRGKFINILPSIVEKCGQNLKYVELRGNECQDESSRLNISRLIKNLIETGTDVEAYAFENCYIQRESFSLFQEKLTQLYLDVEGDNLHEIIELLCQSKCRNLKNFRFESYLNAEILEKIFNNFESLTEVNLCCDNIEHNIVIPMKLCNLKIISLLCEFSNHFDEILLNLMKNNNQLIEIRIYGAFTHNSITYISYYCPLIEQLLICSYDGLTDQSLFSISKLKNLKKLELLQSTAITNNGLINIINNCTLIQKISIWECESVTNNFIQHCIEVAKQHPTQRIELEFENCQKVKIDGFKNILPQNLKLTSLGNLIESLIEII